MSDPSHRRTPPRPAEVIAELGPFPDGVAVHGVEHDGERLWVAPGADVRAVVGSVPAPGGGRDSGLTWAEGRLWVGQYRERKIVCIDPETWVVERTIESDRFVTGVSWSDGELWHGTWEEEASDVRRVDPHTGEVLECLELPAGSMVSGLSAHADRLFCGGGTQGRIRVVRRPGR